MSVQNQKTFASKLELNDNDVTSLDNIISLVKEHGKDAKVIPLLWLCKFKKSYLVTVPRKAYEYVRDNISAHSSIVVDGKKHIYMLNYTGVLIFIKKLGKHCLYLTEILNAEENKARDLVRKKSDEEGIKRAHIMFYNGLVNTSEFCFSLRKTFESLGYSTMYEATRALLKQNLDPDIDYITCLEKSIDDKHHAQNLDICGIGASSVPPNDILSDRMDYLMTRDCFVTIIFGAGTPECKNMKRPFSKIITKYVMGDITLMAEIADHADLGDNADLSLLHTKFTNDGVKAMSINISCRMVPLDKYIKIEEELKTIKAMTESKFVELNSVVNDKKIAFKQNMDDTIQLLNEELAAHSPNKNTHCIFAYIRDSDISDIKYCTFGYVAFDNVEEYKKRIISNHGGGGLFISEPIQYPVGKQVRQMIKQACTGEDEPDVIQIRGDDGILRPHFQKTIPSIKTLLVDMSSGVTESHKNKTKKMIMKSVKPIETTVTETDDKIINSLCLST